MDKEAQEKIANWLHDKCLSGLTDFWSKCLWEKNLAIEILNKIKELGYRKLKDKPPLLSDEKLERLLSEYSGNRRPYLYRRIAQAQREADIKHYEGIDEST